MFKLGSRFHLQIFHLSKLWDLQLEVLQAGKKIPSEDMAIDIAERKGKNMSRVHGKVSHTCAFVGPPMVDHSTRPFDNRRVAVHKSLAVPSVHMTTWYLAKMYGKV